MDHSRDSENQYRTWLVCLYCTFCLVDVIKIVRRHVPCTRLIEHFEYSPECCEIVRFPAITSAFMIIAGYHGVDEQHAIV